MPKPRLCPSRDDTHRPDSSSVPLHRPAVTSSEVATALGSATVARVTNSVDNERVCRICQCGASRERLISPCRCKGTVALVHRTCVETWLGHSNSAQCEICRAPYSIERTPRTFGEWLRHPSSPLDRRNVIADCVCFTILCPLSMASAWLCVAGASYYLSKGNKGEYEALGLIVATVFLIFVFLGWFCVSIRYHYAVWSEWRDSNYRIRLVNSHHDRTAATVQSDRAPASRTAIHMVSRTQSVPIRFSLQPHALTTRSEEMYHSPLYWETPV